MARKGDKKGKFSNLVTFSFLIFVCSSSRAICCVLVRKVSLEDCNFSIREGSLSAWFSALAIALRKGLISSSSFKNGETYQLFLSRMSKSAFSCRDLSKSVSTVSPCFFNFKNACSLASSRFFRSY